MARKKRIFTPEQRLAQSERMVEWHRQRKAEKLAAANEATAGTAKTIADLPEQVLGCTPPQQNAMVTGTTRPPVFPAGWIEKRHEWLMDAIAGMPPPPIDDVEHVVLRPPTPELEEAIASAGSNVPLPPHDPPKFDVARYHRLRAFYDKRKIASGTR